ncbi:MAG: glycosyltransferase family 4 protein [bacterium]
MKKIKAKKKRVLFLSTFITPFIKHDIQILKDFSNVHCLITSGFKAVFQIYWNIFFCDIVFSWFASVYSGIAVSLAKLLGKQTIVVIAGVDVALNTEIGYGIWLTKWKRPFVRTAIRKADTVLVVDPSMKDKAKKLAGYKGDNIRYLPTGYDTSFFMPGASKKRGVLTVASITNEIRLKTKGIDFLLRVAHLLPNVSFTIIGINQSLLKDLGISVSDNVTLLSAMSQKDLLVYFQKAAVYCQPSRSEGLPNALCEAMLCECIPVGTEVGGIPTAIGDTGFIIPFGSIEDMKDSIKKALRENKVLGKKARQRIIQKFPFERRVNGLKKVVLDS